MNAARLALSKAIQQNNYAALQIERGDYWEARQVLPSTLHSLKNLLCWQESTVTSSDSFFGDDSQGSEKSAHREYVDEHDLSTTNHSKLEPSSHSSSGPIEYKTNALASTGDSDQQINLYSIPIHLDHDPRLQQASLSKAEEIAVIASSAATVIFNLALVMHLSVTTTDGKYDSCSSTDESHKSRQFCCLAKAESLYRLAMELILHNMMFPDMDIIGGTLLLAVVNNLGAVRMQRKEREAALVTFQYLMKVLMMMVDRGIVLGSDREWFLGNALLAENRLRTTPSLAAAA